ncbi:FGGY-family carbohydrate kinase [Lentibacillus halophilus]|uniref:FGGY-family carbohydrate kinase n=1 Tax=Lentibacillus halophilus TaxID=295065 RepID=A0ABN0Z580_9BACI
MSKRYVMGIDNGTQSTKVVIFDLKGNEIAYGSCPLKETVSPEPGVVLHPDDDLWDSVYNSIKRCLENFQEDPKLIEGIGLCTIRSCRILLNKDGSLAYPAINWADDRLSEPYKHEDDRVKYVTTTSGYLAFKLTGQMIDTAGNYEVNWPLDLESLDWSDDDQIIADHGLTRDMLFHLVKPGEKLGVIRNQLAQDFGLDKQTPIIATSNDKAVEVLGSGIKKDNTIMISLGTFISAMLLRDNYYENAKNFFPTLAAVPFKYVYESNGIRRGMWTVSWFKKLIGEESVSEGLDVGLSKEASLNAKAEQIPAGSEGLITILDWLPESDKPYRKGLMIGFDQRHSRYHIYRSILEAIAFNIKNNIDLMLKEMNTDINEVVAIGGGSKSDLMMQILSDLFGLPVHRRSASSSASLGAAISVYKYLNVYQSYPEAISNTVKTDYTFYPNSENNVFYNEINDTVVKRIRQYTDEVLKLTHPVFG